MLLNQDNKRKITYIIDMLKYDLGKLTIEVQEFIQLSNYNNRSLEALLVRKDNIVNDIYVVKASLGEYLIKQKNYEPISANNAHTDRPSKIYLTPQKRQRCGTTLREFTKVIDDVTEMKGIKNLTNDDIQKLQELSKQMQILIGDVVTCFGDYFDVISQSLDALEEINPDLYHETITEPIIHKASPGELRTIYAPLYQDQRLIEGIINSYTRGLYSKQDIVRQLSGNTMTEILGKIER